MPPRVDEGLRTCSAIRTTPQALCTLGKKLQGIASLARQYGVRVVLDEIYAPLVLSGASFTPYLSVVGAENGFALTSASKAWNLAGLKAAVAIAGPESAVDLRRCLKK